MSIEGCKDKEDVVCVYYSAMKKDKIMPCAAPLMDLEIFILSEDRKTNTIWYDLYYVNIYELHDHHKSKTYNRYTKMKEEITQAYY